MANSLHSLEQDTPEEESSAGSNDTLAESLKNSVQAPTGSFLLLLMESFQPRPEADLMFKLADYEFLSPSQTRSGPWGAGEDKMDGSSGSSRASSEPGAKAELIWVSLAPCCKSLGGKRRGDGLNLFQFILNRRENFFQSEGGKTLAPGGVVGAAGNAGNIQGQVGHGSELPDWVGDVPALGRGIGPGEVSFKPAYSMIAWLTFPQKNIGWAGPREVRLEEPKQNSS